MTAPVPYADLVAALRTRVAHEPIAYCHWEGEPDSWQCIECTEVVTSPRRPRPFPHAVNCTWEHDRRLLQCIDAVTTAETGGA